MPYSVKSKTNGKEYYLHSVASKNGATALYYFSKDIKPEGGVETLPDGYELSENSRTGLPVLRKSK